MIALPLFKTRAKYSVILYPMIIQDIQSPEGNYNAFDTSLSISETKKASKYKVSNQICCLLLKKACLLKRILKNEHVIKLKNNLTFYN